MKLGKIRVTDGPDRHREAVVIMSNRGSGGGVNSRKWVTDQSRRLIKKAMGEVAPGYVEGTVVPTMFSLWDDNELSNYVRTTFYGAPTEAVEAFLKNLLLRKQQDVDGVFFALPPPEGQVMQMIVSKKQQVPAGRSDDGSKAKNKGNKGKKKGGGDGQKAGGVDYSSVPRGDVVFRPVKEGEGFVQKVHSDRFCGCLGTEHKPLTNCLNCGKVACEAEGYGPCTFCGAMVTPLKSRQRGGGGGKGSTAAVMSLPANASDKEKADAEKAMKLKKNLIEFDRTSAQRTVIYDDQEDYYSTSEWLSPEERKRMQEEAQRAQEEKQLAKEEQRKTYVAFGFAGRTVSVVSGKDVAEMKRAEGVLPESQKPKGLNRIVQSKPSRASKHTGSVPVAPGVDVEPVYAVVKGKKGAAGVALSRTDGSLEKFLESMRFQQIEDSYFQTDANAAAATTTEAETASSESD